MLAFGLLLTLQWGKNKGKNLQTLLEESIFQNFVNSDSVCQAKAIKLGQNGARLAQCGSRPLSDSSRLTGL
jgi:hypothetical protein